MVPSLLLSIIPCQSAEGIINPRPGKDCIYISGFQKWQWAVKKIQNFNRLAWARAQLLRHRQRLGMVGGTVCPFICRWSLGVINYNVAI